jgi:hypothetical protein
LIYGAHAVWFCTLVIILDLKSTKFFWLAFP